MCAKVGGGLCSVAESVACSELTNSVALGQSLSLSKPVSVCTMVIIAATLQVY